MTVPRSTVSLRQRLDTRHFALLRALTCIFPVRVVKPPLRVSTVKGRLHDDVLSSVRSLFCVTVKVAPFAVMLCLGFGVTRTVPLVASTVTPKGTDCAAV